MDYKEIYNKYLEGEITDVEVLERLLLVDAKVNRFWELLKARFFWRVNRELSQEIDSQLEEYLK